MLIKLPSLCRSTSTCTQENGLEMIKTFSLEMLCFGPKNMAGVGWYYLYTSDSYGSTPDLAEQHFC